MRRGLVVSLLFIVIIAVGSFTATVLSGHTVVKGLDLSGGLSVVLQPQGTADGAVLNEAVSIIERRVNGLGVSNAEVTVQGHTVVISLPDIKDPQQALTDLGSTAQLFFRPVYCEIPAYTPARSTTTTTTAPKTTTTTTATKASPGTTTAPTTSPQAAGDSVDARLDSADLVDSGSTSTTAPTTTTRASSTTTAASSSGTSTTTSTSVPPSTVSESSCSASNSAQLPTTPVADDVAKNSVILPVDPSAFSPSDFRYVLGPADMTGSIVSNAAAEIDTTTGQYSVALTLTSKGATEFDNIASSRYACYEEDTSDPPFCAQEAFELDGLVESAPDFQSASFNGNVSITGDFSSSQASNLANQLKYGSLPVRFVPQSTETVSATIGKDSLRAGILAGLGGIIVVMLYMIIYYRALGLVVLVGLCVGAAILYSIIVQLGQSTHPYTLTLAGITGIIVSIGITVDSYVVYFERLKDEVRAGRSVRQSVERSFARAFRTVLTADLVSFMAALILYILTIGDVRGFAFTLGLSTLLDVATAYLFIRPAVILVGRRRTFTENRFLGIARGLGARDRAGEG